MCNKCRRATSDQSLGAENWEASSPFSLATRCQLLLALANHFRALLLRQRQHSLGPFGQLFIDQRMGTGQLLLNLARPERVPPLHRDPVSIGRVGRGANSIYLQKLVKSLRPATERKNDISRVVDVSHGKGLAANLPLAHPVDQNLPPVQRLRRVRQRKANLANALVVHGPASSSELRLKRPESPLQFPLRGALFAVVEEGLAGGGGREDTERIREI